MKKFLAIGAIAVTSLGLAGCSVEPNLAACADVDKLTSLVSTTEVQVPQVKGEILGDLGEAASYYNCPNADVVYDD